jgi:putative ABC transport system substrate-binding protein
VNTRLRALAFAALSLLAVPLAGAQPVRVPRVGLLGVGSDETSPLFEALRQSLGKLGYVVGQSIAFEDRSKVDRYSRLADVAAELVRLKVDLIVAYGTTATQATWKQTRTIPIVTVMGIDPVEAGFAASLARPGANVTGLAIFSQELVGKRVEILKETLPGVSRVAVLWDPEGRGEQVGLARTETAARSMGLKVQLLEVRRSEDLEKAFASMVKERAEAFLQVPSNLLLAHRARVVELAARHRLPSVFSSKGYVEAGGLMSYGADVKEVFRQAAIHADRILRGARPGDIPFERPTKFELVINLKAAKALGLTIPPALLFRADQTIE